MKRLLGAFAPSWVGAGTVIALALAPLAIGTSGLSELEQIFYLAVAVFSVNLLVGVTGQMSVGNGALMCVGAYASAISIQTYGLSYWEAIPVAIAAAGIAGAICGLPALRLAGMYLAMVTLGFAVVAPQIILRYSTWTGGSTGLTVGPTISSPIGNVRNWTYWVLLASGAIVFTSGRRVLRSFRGRALLAIRDQPLLAATQGINVPLTKVAMFGISGAIAGFAGWMFVVVNQFVSPPDFTLTLSIDLLVAMMVGGRASVLGPLLGAAFLVWSQDQLPQIGLNSFLLPGVYGLLMIVVLLVAPGGVVGIAASAAKSGMNWFRHNEDRQEAYSMSIETTEMGREA